MYLIDTEGVTLVSVWLYYMVINSNIDIEK